MSSIRHVIHSTIFNRLKHYNMITLYIVLSYLVMLGVMINNYDKTQDVRPEAVFVYIISPITLPIIIGMIISDK